jgi:hypothetical protein
MESLVEAGVNSSVGGTVTSIAGNGRALTLSCLLSSMLVYGPYSVMLPVFSRTDL